MTEAQPRLGADDNASFWDAIARRELWLKKCDGCGTVLPPGSFFCAECWSRKITPIRASGRGRIHSFVVYHRAFSENETPPYSVAMIALDEGPRIVSRIQGGDDFDIGDVVEAVWSAPSARGPTLAFAVHGPRTGETRS